MLWATNNNLSQPRIFMKTEPLATEQQFTWADLEKLDMLHEPYLTASYQCDCQYSIFLTTGWILGNDISSEWQVILVSSLLFVDSVNVYILKL